MSRAHALSSSEWEAEAPLRSAPSLKPGDRKWARTSLAMSTFPGDTTGRLAATPGLRCPGFCVFALLALPFILKCLLQKQLRRERKTHSSLVCAPLALFCAPAPSDRRALRDYGNDGRD
jgi:hypothetical protein